jgi:hypothetical protein
MIADSAKTPDTMKAWTTVFPDSNSKTAGPVASGSTLRTAVTKLRSVSVFSGSPLGRTSIRWRVWRDPVPGDIPRNCIYGDALGLELLSQLIERVAERFRNRGLGTHASRRIGFSEFRQQSSKPPCCIAPGTAVVSGTLPQAVGRG